MTLKITLTIDQDNEQGTMLIGLLAKAFGRGEAGVNELRIERVGPSAEGVKLRPVRKSTIAKLVARGPTSRAPGLGSHTLKTGKPNSITITLAALRMDVTLEGLKELWRAGGLNTNGVGATLSKLRKRGLVKRVGEGNWKLTAQGLETLNRYEAEREKVVGHDSAND